MLDFRTIGTRVNEMCIQTGRYTGAGNTAPTAVANTSRGSSIARTGTGALTLTIIEAPLIPQSFCAWINSPNNCKMVNTPPFGTSPIGANVTLALQVVWTNNGASVDLQSYEELNFEMWFAKTSQP